MSAKEVIPTMPTDDPGLEPGDRVRVVNRDSTLRGRVGTVVPADDGPADGPLVWVEFPAESVMPPRLAIRFERAVRVPFLPDELMKET